MKEISQSLRNDPGWRAALYILEHAFAHHKGAWTFVDPVDKSIHFREMRDTPWSHGEALMLQAAHSMFNGEDGEGKGVNLMELLCTLDDDNSIIVLDAMRAYRRWA